MISQELVVHLGEERVETKLSVEKFIIWCIRLSLFAFLWLWLGRGILCLTLFSCRHDEGCVLVMVLMNSFV
jgi:hypothetical protein